MSSAIGGGIVVFAQVLPPSTTLDPSTPTDVVGINDDPPPLHSTN
jgi:hypothetical protein